MKKTKPTNAPPGIELKATGNVWKIVATVGDSMEEDQPIMILESMKMEIPVEAPASGTLSKIHVEPEQPVEEDQLLAEVDG